MEHLTLSNICGGAVQEVFERELRQLIQNLKDPSTPPDQKRRLTVVLDFVPFSDRSGAEVTMKCETKLAGVEPAKGSVFFLRNDQGEAVAYPHDPRQENLFAQSSTKTKQ